MTEYKYRKRFTYLGKRYSVYANTLVDLGQKYADKLAELKTGSKVVSGDTTFREWAEKCIDAYKTGQKPITKKKYKNRVECCITRYIGNYTIKSITPMDLQEILNRQEGNSKTQINEVYQALRFLFRHALENHLRADDPSLYLEKPAGTHNSRRALTAKERETVIKVGKTDRRYYFYLLMLFCGCRPSEAAECQGRDIVCEDGCYLLHIRGTKTALSDRFVPIPDELLTLIKKTPKFDFIACTQEGHKIQNCSRLWHSFKRQLNIEMGAFVYRNHVCPPYPIAPDIVPYCFRHEYCSDLARKGIDIRTAQQLMGHSSIQLTANIYTHVNKESIIEAGKVLNGWATQRATNG